MIQTGSDIKVLRCLKEVTTIMSSTDEIGDLPSAQECQKRVEQFAEVTNTDEALAQFYLQERQWNLDAALQDYFADNPGPPIAKKAKTEAKAPTQAEGDKEKRKSTHAVEEFTFVTWNLDGLDDKNLKARTNDVIKTLKTRDVDVIFLQEVIPSTYNIFKSQLGDTYLITDHDNRESLPNDYFTVVMLKRATVHRDSVHVKKFEGSVMMRDLTLIEAKINDKKLLLINTHLESTKDYAEERMSQLSTAFDHIKKSDPSTTVIFAGDLNIRDKEVDKVGLPDKTKDLWIATGQRKEVQYTWDMLRNQNKEFGGKFKPRMRFDRVYFRPSNKSDIKPEHFGLVGIEKVPGHQIFPSDHWGIFCIFKMVK